jgi:mono/diheme cytochrome c family protein
MHGTSRTAAAVVIVLALAAAGSLVAAGARAGSPTSQTADQAAVPTFSRDVAPILFTHCATCHRPGEIGPMPLLTYDDAEPYAAQIALAVRSGHMPPWHADAAPGTFLNERRLNDVDQQTLARWASGGAPRGNPADLPPAPVFAEGWAIEEPDAVFEMPDAFHVPAEGTIPYQYFEVPTNFTEDRWVQAMEIRPGARDAVHHVILYAREPDGSPARSGTLSQPPGQGLPTEQPPRAGGRSARRRLGTIVATTAPGTNAMIYRPGAALRIRAGTVLTFQMHYTAHGQAMADRTRVGFVFAEAPPEREVFVSQFTNVRLSIPPGAADHRVDSAVTFEEDAHLVGLLPHTHLRGTRWFYRVIYPDGRTETLLDVPRYDFNWQTYYLFASPLAMPRGTRIEASAWYDNSPRNAANPDPTRLVRWGEQTWDEMQYTGITYTVDGAAGATAGR